MPNKIRRWLFRQLQDNFIVYFLVVVVFAIGIVVGAMTIKILDIDQKNDIILFLNSFFKTIDGNNLDSLPIIKQSIIDNFKTIGLIWLTGIIIIGLPIIPVVILFRGFALGFTVGFLVNEYGAQGFLFSILGILPHNLFTIPGLVSIASTGMAFSINSIKERRLNTKNKNLYFNIINYSVLILLFSILVLAGCLVEAYISPIFLRLLSGYFK